jgi:hypothetical protein
MNRKQIIGTALAVMIGISSVAAQQVGIPPSPGWLRHDNLTTLSVEEAKTIMEREGRVLSLDGLKELSSEAAKVLAGFKGEELDLMGLQTLPAETAKALAACTCDLGLNGLTTISDEAAAELARFAGRRLFLKGLKSLSPAAAKALAEYKGQLFLSIPLPAKAAAAVLAPPVAAVEEDVAFFEKKYQKKITGVKPKSEYPDPDEFYSAIGQQLGIPEIAWKAAAEKFGWKKDDGINTFTMLKGGPTAGGGQGTWDVMFIRSKINPETKKPDPATLQQVMVQIDYDGNITFPEIPQGKR